MAPIAYNRRNKKALAAHELKVLAHPRNDDEPAETDSQSNFDNPIGQPRGGVQRQVPSPPRGEPKWESNFKIELPEFYDSLNHEEFMDWLNQVERIFDIHEFQAYGGCRSTQVSTQGSPTTNSAQPFKIDNASLPSQLLVQSNQSLKQHKVLHLSATSVEKLGTRPQIARKEELMLKDVHFTRRPNDWEMGDVDDFLRTLGSNLPPTEDEDRMRWKLTKYGDFDIRSFYNKLRTPLPIIFPWKGVWKVKAPRHVSFFVWTVVWDRILTDDTLRGRGLVFVNWCIMCRSKGETVDHLLLHCGKAYRLWSFVFRSFGFSWVLPRSVADTLFGGRSNTSSLYKRGDRYTLQPKKGKASPKPMVKMKKVGWKSIYMAAYTCSLDTKQQQTLNL
uniref:Reverse transcriptase zinc-binding domain-containing protein n=1 Tax=Quercus lobata TaxID=97700 RepID=A0A7N2N1U9_QUELO